MFAARTSDVAGKVSRSDAMRIFRTALGGSLASLAMLLVVASAGIASAQTFKVLHSFCSTTNASGYCADGMSPGAAPVQGTNGDLYGTTSYGGSNNAGTVFRMTPAGKLTTIYSFCSLASCADGYLPWGSLLLGKDGNFYGVTSEGGTNNWGTALKITPAGKLTTLYSFCSLASCADGQYPQAGLIQGVNGNFYGTTNEGANGWGTVFELTPAGVLTTLFSFCESGPCNVGLNPMAPLVQTSSGNLYGVAYTGPVYATNPCGGSFGGTAFEIAPSGTLTAFGGFCNPPGGSVGIYPNSLVLATNGNFFGTTVTGGAGGGGSGTGGTIFEMTPAGSFTWLYSFCLQTGCPDGYDPKQVMQATDANFYGTTGAGGTNGQDAGTVFELTAAGQLATLHSFNASLATDGSSPSSGVFQATNGTFYGTASGGGKYSHGVVYSVSNGLGPFVSTVPASDKVGAKIIVLGTDLTGATSVTFNGTSASFTVVSATEIKATVPTGATTGTVLVTTPRGTLSSNVVFQIP